VSNLVGRDGSELRGGVVVTLTHNTNGMASEDKTFLSILNEFEESDDGLFFFDLWRFICHWIALGLLAIRWVSVKRPTCAEGPSLHKVD